MERESKVVRDLYSTLLNLQTPRKILPINFSIQPQKPNPPLHFPNLIIPHKDNPNPTPSIPSHPFQPTAKLPHPHRCSNLLCPHCPYDNFNLTILVCQGIYSGRYHRGERLGYLCHGTEDYTSVGGEYYIPFFFGDGCREEVSFEDES